MQERACLRYVLPTGVPPCPLLRSGGHGGTPVGESIPNRRQMSVGEYLRQAGGPNGAFACSIPPKTAKKLKPGQFGVSRTLKGRWELRGFEGGDLA